MFLKCLNDPPREFTLAPFWLWNDRLDSDEIRRQIADFDEHGVYGFVIHPRLGLPRSIGWMSDAMLEYMAVAIDEAHRRHMTVILYDEGMYPSGSSSGQVVATNPRFRCRGLSCLPATHQTPPPLPEGHNLLAVASSVDGRRWAIVEHPLMNSHIRGLHYIDDDPPRDPGPDNPNNPGCPRPTPPEDKPPAADLLNPDATRCFIQLVYQKLFDRFAPHFGKTIRAIFTDEPTLLGRCDDLKTLRPGTTDILLHVQRILGYDFTPHLPALWLDNEPDAARYRRDYLRAVRLRLDETFYQPISQWCQDHGVALTGHPDHPDNIGTLRQFHWPGQDLVWRSIVPGSPKALEGPQATMAKCTSSCAIHLRRERNANELYGAYGPQLTYDEMKWLADWCFVRGVDLLIPSAFYYSIRGPRVDERPPDVGPNSPWWPRFHIFADYCRRLSWLNAGSRHVCDVAVLGLSDYLPWQSAKVLQEHQIDFNYLEARHLWEDAVVDEDGIRLAGMNYRVLVLDVLPEMPAMADEPLRRLREAGKVIAGGDSSALVEAVTRRVSPDLKLEPHDANLRYRHVIKEGSHVVLLHNEGGKRLGGQLTLSVRGPYRQFNPWTGEMSQPQPSVCLDLAPHETVLVMAGELDAESAMK